MAENTNKPIKKDVRSIRDFTREEVCEIFDISHQIKKDLKRGKFSTEMENKVLAMLFEKPSLRTKFTFDTGMYQLGGHAIYMGPQEIGIGKRETVYDIAKNLERYADMIMVRTFAQSNVDELCEYARIPVINGLTDEEHPCQAMTDIFTLEEKFGNVQGLNLTYVGDGNNVCHSLMMLATMMGINFTAASPAGYEAQKEYVDIAQNYCETSGGSVKVVNDPKEGVKDAHVIYTDVWASMGWEAEAEERKKVFEPFQVNKKLVESSSEKVLVMHDLPAHRGEEITDEVMDADYSIVFDQAENRLHAQKGIMVYLQHYIEEHKVD